MDKGSYASIPAQRLLVWMTIVLAILFGVGWVGLMRFFPPPPANLPADQVTELYAAHNIRFRIGVIIALITGGFLIPLTLVISIQMARLEKGVPIWALMQALTGTLGTFFLWFPVTIWGTAAFSVERAPELTKLAHELAWLTFITPLSLFPMQLLGIIIVAFSKDEEDHVSAFPRWIGYLTAWQAVQSFGGPIAMIFKTGIFSWNGLLPFWLPFLLFTVWIAAISYTILRALRHQQKLQGTVVGAA